MPLSHKILHIIGNRPHYMKLAPVFRAVQKKPITQIIIHSGQHYDPNLSSNFRKDFELPEENYNLQIGSDSSLGFLAHMLEKLEPILFSESPDLILVYGDTHTTSAGAIAAAKLNIPLGHVEAGLREYNKSIPEEINKLLTDAVADLLFVPSETGMNGLLKEGKEKNSYLVGDTGLDLLKQSGEKIKQASSILQRYNLEEGKYILMTCHRAANTDNKENLTQIVNAVAQIDEAILWPLHPRTRKALQHFNLLHTVENSTCTLTEPLGYFETQALLSYARRVITDSGGIIKEAYFHKVPSVIIDQQTEWLEIINAGWSKIAGPNTEKIVAFTKSEIESDWKELYGDGKAGERIADICFRYLENKA